YYFRKVRINGRVVSQYVGGGALGAEAAALDAQQRAERCARADARQAEWAHWDELDTLLQEIYDAVEQLVRATLQAAGYHYHRGEWRKHRERESPRRTGPSRPGTPPRLGGADAVPDPGREGRSGDAAGAAGSAPRPPAGAAAAGTLRRPGGAG